MSLFVFFTLQNLCDGDQNLQKHDGLSIIHKTLQFIDYQIRFTASLFTDSHLYYFQ